MSKETKDKESKEVETSSRSRSARKTNYERVSETQIPDEVIAHFEAEDWVLGFKRWRLDGKQQDAHIASKLREGWEFVTMDELPDWYQSFFDTESYKSRDECVVVKDMVLMKADKAMIEDRRQYYRQLAKNELNAVDIHVLQKKGFKDLGTKSSVTMSEPRFK